MEPCAQLVIGGRYRLDAEIGRGGVGVVWRAHSVTLDIPCAIKFLLPEYAKDPSHRARFIHEARAAASLRSPHTVLVFDVDEWEGTPYLAMELLNGQSLEQCLAERGRLSPELTSEIVRQIALGLSKAHGAGLVHRDLKPDNVFLVQDDGPLSVKLLDFGIAKRTQPSLDFRTVTGALIGTPYYMSPEQAKGSKDVDFRSDLWSLAVLTYRCLSGRLAFEAESLPDILLKIVHSPMPSLTAANPALPRAVEAWWRNAADRDPDARPGSAIELSQGLHKALFGATFHVTQIPELMISGMRMRPPEETLRSSPGAGPRLAHRKRLKRTLLWIASASVLVLGALGYWLGRGQVSRAVEPASLVHEVRPSDPSAASRRATSPSPPPVTAAVPAAPTLDLAASATPDAAGPTATAPIDSRPVDESARTTEATRNAGVRARTREPAPVVRPAPTVAPAPRKVMAPPPVAAPKEKPRPALDDRLGF